MSTQASPSPTSTASGEGVPVTSTKPELAYSTNWTITLAGSIRAPDSSVKGEPSWLRAQPAGLAS